MGKPSPIGVYESSTPLLHAIDESGIETWCGFPVHEEGDQGMWTVVEFLARGRRETCWVCRSKVTSIARKWRLA